jgi:hypothetical protein
MSVSTSQQRYNNNDDDMTTTVMMMMIIIIMIIIIIMTCVQITSVYNPISTQDWVIMVGFVIMRVESWV